MIFRFNVSPSSTIELLNRIVQVFKDYCGQLTEEAIRKNFTLIYELLDEMMDHGYPQNTLTETLKNCVHNEPIVLKEQLKAASLISSLGNMFRMFWVYDLSSLTHLSRIENKKFSCFESSYCCWFESSIQAKERNLRRYS